eukprot:15325582-Ditylum_brightwellii.AAC.1
MDNHLDRHQKSLCITSLNIMHQQKSNGYNHVLSDENSTSSLGSDDCDPPQGNVPIGRSESAPCHGLGINGEQLISLTKSSCQKDPSIVNSTSQDSGDSGTYDSPMQTVSKLAENTALKAVTNSVSRADSLGQETKSSFDLSNEELSFYENDSFLGTHTNSISLEDEVSDKWNQSTYSAIGDTDNKKVVILTDEYPDEKKESFSGHNKYGEDPEHGACSVTKDGEINSHNNSADNPNDESESFELHVINDDLCLDVNSNAEDINKLDTDRRNEQTTSLRDSFVQEESISSSEMSTDTASDKGYNKSGSRQHKDTVSPSNSQSVEKNHKENSRRSIESSVQSESENLEEVSLSEEQLPLLDDEMKAGIGDKGEFVDIECMHDGQDRGIDIELGQLEDDDTSSESERQKMLMPKSSMFAQRAHRKVLCRILLIVILAVLATVVAIIFSKKGPNESSSIGSEDISTTPSLTPSIPPTVSSDVNPLSSLLSISPSISTYVTLSPSLMVISNSPSQTMRASNEPSNRRKPTQYPSHLVSTSPAKVPTFNPASSIYESALPSEAVTTTYTPSVGRILTRSPIPSVSESPSVTNKPSVERILTRSPIPSVSDSPS